MLLPDRPTASSLQLFPQGAVVLDDPDLRLAVSRLAVRGPRREHLGTVNSPRLLSFEEVVQALSMDQRWHHARLPPTPHR